MNKLFIWRTTERLSRQECGDRLGVSAETIRRWETGERIPEKSKMAAIYSETLGEVGPADFYALATPNAVTGSTQGDAA